MKRAWTSLQGNDKNDDNLDTWTIIELDNLNDLLKTFDLNEAAIFKTKRD